MTYLYRLYFGYPKTAKQFLGVYDEYSLAYEDLPPGFQVDPPGFEWAQDDDNTRKFTNGLVEYSIERELIKE